MTTDYPTADSEVVSLCAALIRIDTSNYGDSDGPGERLAAEKIMEWLDEVGLVGTYLESAPRPTWLSASLAPTRFCLLCLCTGTWT